MKLAERKKFIGLAVQSSKQETMFLCSLCKYFYEGARDYETGVNDSWGCEHPIEKVRDINQDYTMYGADCWAFRPRKPYQNLADSAMYEAPTVEKAERIADEYLNELTGEKFG